jgi:hypothetical protein
VGTRVLANIETAEKYFLRHGIDERKMMEALSGMDVHSPIEVVQLSKGDWLALSMILPAGKDVKKMTDLE